MKVLSMTIELKKETQMIPTIKLRNLILLVAIMNLRIVQVDNGILTKLSIGLLVGGRQVETFLRSGTSSQLI